MTEKDQEVSQSDPLVADPNLHDRRDFLISLGKWSKAVIGGVVLGGVLIPEHEAKAVGWSNHGNWVNLGGGGPGWGGWGWGYGPGWGNGPGWYDGWHNNRPRWYNGRPGGRCWHGWCNRPYRGRRGWYNRGWDDD